MKYCTNCKKEYYIDEKNCPNCGMSLFVKESNQVVDNNLKRCFKAAVVALIIYFVILIAIFGLGTYISYLGKGPYAKGYSFNNFISSFSVALFFSIIPLIISSILAYCSKRKGIFIINIILLILTIFLISFKRQIIGL